MSRKTRRYYFLAFGVLALASAIGIVAYTMSGNLVFFYSPTDVKEKGVTQGQRIRVGGLVEKGSVKRDNAVATFTITDGLNTIHVYHKGFLPDLFREGQGVVVEGRIDDRNVFEADEVLAKHDENYMPPEVADSLKKTGQWQHIKGEEGKMPAFLEHHGDGAPSPVKD